MATTELLINEDFCFNPRKNVTADVSNRALRKFAEGFDEAVSLGGNLPIILDANILLGYYGMSQSEKTKLIQFIKQNKERIYITKQVEQEFLRNRLSVIKKDFFGPLNKIGSDFQILQKQIINLLQSFKETKKTILSQDYPPLWERLEKMDSDIATILNDKDFIEDISKQVGTTTLNNKNIEYIDDLLGLVSILSLTEELVESEISFIKKLYGELLADYTNEKDALKWKCAIPGCGDKKDDPTGDFIIIHEMLKFMRRNATSCIFLTNDITKGDWVQMDRNHHCHYLVHSFYNTDNIIFIVHAETALTTISFESIYKDPTNNPSLAITNEESIDVYTKSGNKKGPGPSNAPTTKKEEK